MSSSKPIRGRHLAERDRAKAWRNVAIVLVFLFCLTTLTSSRATSSDPSMFINGKHSGIHKSTASQRIIPNKWTDFKGGGFALHGPRALFFAQLHLRCSKKPKFVKIRLARHHKNGSLDTTGTNTWVLGANAPKTWQGTIWWESKTKYPITAQFYVAGGKCVSPERQFKWWRP